MDWNGMYIPILRQSYKFNGVRVRGQEWRNIVIHSRVGEKWRRKIVDNSDKKIADNPYKIPFLITKLRSSVENVRIFWAGVWASLHKLTD